MMNVASLLAKLLLIMTMIYPASVSAQEVTLRLHHFMTKKSPEHSKLLIPFAKRLEKASSGRIKVELFDSMSLGGRPGDLYDQAADGAVDIILTLPGYTSGRFPKAEVFELPFLMTDTVATSKAFWDLIDEDLQQSDFDEVQILSGWVHSPGVLHSKKPITKLEDMQGLEMRGPTRMVTSLFKRYGTSPVGMPLPKIPENLSKGVITGAALPWEIAPTIKLSELVSHHTEFGGDKAIYTAVFVLAMNQDVYDDLPDDLRRILDAETGKKMAEQASKIVLDADIIGKRLATRNNIYTLGTDEVSRWVKASKPVYTNWIRESKNKGFNGSSLINRAKNLIRVNGG